MSKLVMNVSVYRGWKQISEFLNTTEKHAQELEKKFGLPVRREGGTVVLTNWKYIQWHEKQPALSHPKKDVN